MPSERLRLQTRQSSIHFGGLVVVAIAVLLPAARCPAQHLWWDKEGEKDAATCLYGETTVLATIPGIYYSSAGWWPGEAAGGYCGIQHNGPKERRTIFAIWDTSPELRPAVTAADRRTYFGRFGGEGEGGHTHMLWDWKERDTFRFFIQKAPGEKPDTTDARYYVYDPVKKVWIHGATITSPNGGKPSVATLGGGINSFLENFAGADKAVPKLALYRLWLGPRPNRMRCLTKAGGDGIWGQLNGCYFLAEGSEDRLQALFARLEKDYGRPVFGAQGKELPPIPDRPLPDTLIQELAALPQAEPVQSKSHSPEDGKQYTLRSLKSGKFLTLKDAAARAGVDLVQDNRPEKPTVWRLEKAGDGFRIVSPVNTLVADATADAARLQPRRRNDADTQVWEFVKIDDAYHIATKRDGRVLDVEGGSDNDGARIILYGRNKDKPAANQLWILTEVKAEPKKK